MSLILIVANPFENEPLNVFKLGLVRRILQLLRKENSIDILTTFIDAADVKNPARASEVLKNIRSWFVDPPLRIRGKRPGEADLDRLLYNTQEWLVRIIDATTEDAAKRAFILSKQRFEDFLATKRQVVTDISSPDDREPGLSLRDRFVAEYGDPSLLRGKGSFLVEMGSLLHQNGYTRGGVTKKLRDYGENITSVSKSKKADRLWEVVSIWEDTFAPSDFFAMSPDAREASVLEELGANLGNMMHAKDPAELEGFKRLTNSTVQTLLELKKNRYLRFSLGHADRTAERKGYKVAVSGAKSRSYSQGGTIVTIFIDDHEHQIGWIIQQHGEKKINGSEKVNPDDLRSIGWAITGIFDRAAGDEPVSDKEEKKVKRSLGRNGRMAVTGILIALTSTALLVFFRKKIYHYSKTLYFKFKLLLDGWRKKGWAPGKRLSTGQRLELISFLKGMTVEELKAAIHATKDIKPLKPVSKAR